LYRELLGRQPDPQGEASWLASLQQAGDGAARRASVIAAFLNSPEYLRHFVSCVYESFLQRAPDEAGLQFWVQQLGSPGSPSGAANRMDEQAVAASILSSPEYINLHGGTARGWVDGLYQDLLGRAADLGGSAFWVQQADLPGLNQTRLVRGFLSSPEAVQKLLNASFPAVQTSASLPPAGAPATGAYALADLTGGGWENLFLRGNVALSGQPNDGFFAELAGQTPWDAVIEQMLNSDRYFNARQPR
jgi:hypothetical protein